VFTLQQKSVFTVETIRCSRKTKFCVHGRQKFAITA
jgi:hypothetical protein